VVALHVPPLRDRQQDIPRFIEYFLNIYRQRFNRPNLDISVDTRRRLQDYSWPGNVRELRNCLERAAAISIGDMIEVTQIPFLRDQQKALATRGAMVTATETVPKTLEELEREHILRVLNDSNGNRERAAAILGISSRTLYRKLREYETESKSFDLASEG
jgi:two-component system response regulator HydG